jgi:transcriptional regulator of NAD metabolism
VGLDEARTAMERELERFLEQQARAPEVTHTHPIFGEITAEEWSRTHYKHAQHHLLQFGLIR